MDDESFIEYLLYLREFNVRGPRRYLRDPENPLEKFDGLQFYERYRFSKEVFLSQVFPLVSNAVDTVNMRGCPKPTVVKVLAVLRFYATGKFQIDTGDIHGISQPTVCQLVKKVSYVLATHLPQFIKFPNQTGTISQQFYSVARFPGVVGCIDCTHVPIQCPSREGGEHFRNRKGYFSINVQAVSGPRGEIFDLVARWPGSAHDSRIFDNSSLKMKFEQREINGILLGDSGYAQTRYLFTPVLNPSQPAEERYNQSHIKTRNTVERMFGTWKRRFACLRRKLANKKTTCLHIISACAVLHNISVYANQPPLPEEDDHDGDEPDMPPPVQPTATTALGAVIKNRFIAEHFT